MGARAEAAYRQEQAAAGKGELDWRRLVGARGGKLPAGADARLGRASDSSDV